MADADRIFPDEYLPNEQASSAHKKWEQANPNGDAPKWRTYRDAVLAYKANGQQPVAPAMATAHGRALVAAGKSHMSVTDLGSVWVPPEPPVEPPTTNAYFVSDWDTVNNGLMKWEPWATLFQVGTPTTIDLGLFGGPGISAAPNGRAAVVTNPWTGSGKLLRLEIRNSDPASGTNPFQKEELGSYEPATWPDRQWVNPSELWIMMEWWLPDGFGLASGGSNAFTNLADLHPSSNSGIPALGLGGYSTTNIQFYAGIPGQLQRKNFIPLIAANRNRKLTIVIGAKIATSGGWAEAWLDGVNTIPRFNVNTAEATENGPYWKQGLYKYTDSTFPGTGCVVYFGRTLLGQTKADVT